MRAWFAGQDFVEVETGALQMSPGNETHLHAFGTTLVAPHGGRLPLYLRTSPEFACKKLLAAGEQRIVEFAKVFRNRERGALHHPEFTLVEWYRAGKSYRTLMADCVAIMQAAAQAAGSRQLVFRGRSADAFVAPERLTVAEAFARFAGIDLLATLPDGKPDRDSFARAARAADIRIGGDDAWGDIFSRVLVERIENNLGIGRATILDEYPAALSALARPAHDPRVAERFELYVCGVELANGFGELVDAAEQRLRLEGEMAEKERIYGERYPIDEDFIAAIAQMPQACGIALGLDRLVMLATGASRIDQVLWTPIEEPPE
jgi:lysyl-tRNA synthetase class 2